MNQLLVQLQILNIPSGSHAVKWAEILLEILHMIIRKLEALFTINTNAAQFQKAAVQLDHLAEKAQTVMNAIAGYWAVQALQNFVINTSFEENLHQKI